MKLPITGKTQELFVIRTITYFVIMAATLAEVVRHHLLGRESHKSLTIYAWSSLLKIEIGRIKHFSIYFSSNSVLFQLGRLNEIGQLLAYCKTSLPNLAYVNANEFLSRPCRDFVRSILYLACSVSARAWPNRSNSKKRTSPKTSVAWEVFLQRKNCLRDTDILQCWGCLFLTND